MPDFSLHLYTMPVERLINPRERLKGISIPIEIIKLFPLREQSFENINENTDCIQFLEFWNHFPFDNAADLKEYISNDTFYSSFLKTSEDTNTGIFIIAIMKYLFTIKRLLQYLVSDDSAFSYHLPFLTEALYDLECSFYIMKGGYFKQSLQTLRSVLEVTLLHAYFGLKFLNNDELEIAVKKNIHL